MEKQRHAEDGDAKIDKVCEAFHGACVFLLYLFFGKSVGFVWYVVVSCELDSSLCNFSINFYIKNTDRLTVCDVSSFFLKNFRYHKR